MRFKYIGDTLIMDDKLPEDAWESIGSVDEFCDALNKKEEKNKKLSEIRACGNGYEA